MHKQTTFKIVVKAGQSVRLPSITYTMDDFVAVTDDQVDAFGRAFEAMGKRGSVPEPSHGMIVDLTDFCPECGASWSCEHEWVDGYESMATSVDSIPSDTARAMIDRQIAPGDGFKDGAQRLWEENERQRQQIERPPHFMLACELPEETLREYARIRQQALDERMDAFFRGMGERLQQALAPAFEQIQASAEQLSVSFRDIAQTFANFGCDIEHLPTNRAERRKARYRPTMKDGSYNRELWRYHSIHPQPRSRGR